MKIVQENDYGKDYFLMTYDSFGYYDESHNKEELFDKKAREFMIREGWDELSRKELEQKVSEALELLMKLGQVEQLVGEDGEFYYRSIKK